MTPQVVVVGRPNVGKSSLFNWLVEKRIAIEDPTAGVTRDRLVQRVDLDGRVIDLVDTGGMGFDDPDAVLQIYGPWFPDQKMTRCRSLAVLCPLPARQTIAIGRAGLSKLGASSTGCQTF